MLTNYIFVESFVNFCGISDNILNCHDFFSRYFTKIGRILKNLNVNIFCEFQIFSLYGTSPFCPVCATFLAELCKPARRLLQRAVQTLYGFSKSVVKLEKKIFFVLGLSFSGGTSQVEVFLRYFGHICLALGSVPMGHFVYSRFS